MSPCYSPVRLEVRGSKYSRVTIFATLLPCILSFLSSRYLLSILPLPPRPYLIFLAAQSRSFVALLRPKSGEERKGGKERESLFSCRRCFLFRSSLGRERKESQLLPPCWPGMCNFLLSFMKAALSLSPSCAKVASWPRYRPPPSLLQGALLTR